MRDSVRAKTGGIKIAVLSGKGGSGKTFLSVNLASAAGRAVYMDCDVEEPNGRLFLKPTRVAREAIAVKMPVLNESMCTGCRKCVDFCKFNAYAFIKNKPYLFEEVCHSCGGCALLCPENALTEKDRNIGAVESGVSSLNAVLVVTGILNTGEATGIPIIKKLLKKAESYQTPVFIDCPPGSACGVMESVKAADYCVLVAEPTIFGAHDLSMAYRLVRLYDKPSGVVLNKCLEGGDPSEEFCLKNGVPILGRIAYDGELGALNSNAEIAFEKSGKYRRLFSSLLEKTISEAQSQL